MTSKYFEKENVTECVLTKERGKEEWTWDDLPQVLSFCIGHMTNREILA